MNAKPKQNEAVPALGVASGSDLGCIAARFIIFQQPGTIPMKKGPFRDDDQVEKMLIEMRPYCHADTIYTVAEVTHDHDLWLTIASEFLAFREVCRMPDDEDQNTEVTNAPRAGK